MLEINAECSGVAGKAKDRLIKAIQESNENEFFAIVAEYQIDWEHIGHCCFISACKGTSVSILEKFFQVTPNYVLERLFAEAKLSVQNYSVAQVLKKKGCDIPIGTLIKLYFGS